MREPEGYSKALDKTKDYTKEPVGKSSYNPPSESDKIIIAQNNTIIELLIIVLEKLNKEKQTTDYSRQLEDISEKFRNLKITKDKSRKELIPGKPVLGKAGFEK